MLHQPSLGIDKNANPLKQQQSKDPNPKLRRPPSQEKFEKLQVEPFFNPINR